MAEKHHFLSLDKSQESIPMWKAQKTSRNVAQIRHTGYNQKCKEISPISYGKSKRQTSLKFIQYKFQGHKASRRGIVADQVQLGSISIQPMADPLTNSEFYRSHRTQSPAFNVSAPRSWEISRSQDHARRGLKFIDFIVKWPNMPRTSANCPNNCYAQLPNICYLKSKISRIQKDPKGSKRIQKVEPGRAGEDCDHHPWGLRSAPIGPAYGTQLPSEIKVLHKEPPKHLLQDGSIADTTDTIQRYSKIFKDIQRYSKIFKDIQGTPYTILLFSFPFRGYRLLQASKWATSHIFQIPFSACFSYV
jgi:hypothetical protein